MHRLLKWIWQKAIELSCQGIKSIYYLWQNDYGDNDVARSHIDSTRSRHYKAQKKRSWENLCHHASMRRNINCILYTEAQQFLPLSSFSCSQSWKKKQDRIVASSLNFIITIRLIWQKKSFRSIFTWLEHVQEIIVTGRHSMYDDDVENNDWNIFLNSARRWNFFIIRGWLSSMHPVYFLVNLLL